ncbi:MAG: integrase [Proteobacteria bacterium]|nr:MAG: integrase [Pseudomonadota bacterium]PCI44017.1 MAG: integrase [Pseudomonadota bacterium]
MSITKTNQGYLVNTRPNGHSGPRFRRTFKSHAEAKAFQKHINATHKETTDWEKPKTDNRKLSDIAKDWHTYHGHTIGSGEKRLQQLEATAESLGDPLAIKIDPKDFLVYRRKRLEDGITENHLNHELSYLKSAFNELIRVDAWNLPNPYGKIKKLKMDERELYFLTLEEIESLLLEINQGRNKDTLVITKICLSIGCRWGEAQNLRAEQIHHGKIHLTKTKNSKNRSVPISDQLANEIFINRPSRGQLFVSAWESFENAINRSDIQLPRGQMTHVLRHTFASHFVMDGGNILKLKDILGHKTIQMTMIYAKLSPSHLATAIKCNPLAILARPSKDKSETENEVNLSKAGQLRANSDNLEINQSAH